MKHLNNLYLLLLCIAFTACTKTDEKQYADSTSDGSKENTYILDESWPDLPADIELEGPTGLAVNSHNNIVVFHRAGRPWSYPPPEEEVSKNSIITIDGETGTVLNNWGKGLFLMSHGLEIDKEDNIWVIDVGLQQLLKFNPQGVMIDSLGEARTIGYDSTHFTLPADMAFAPDNSFYVADGYGNSRIIHYNSEMNFVNEWGNNGPSRSANRGNKKGEFDVPHGIDVDRNGYVYVADRENNRIQKFDSKGNFVSLWENTKAHQLYAVAIDHKNNYLFAVDYDSIQSNSNIYRFDLDLNLQLEIQGPGTSANEGAKFHDILVDHEGNIYTADIRRNRVVKYKLIKS